MFSTTRIKILEQLETPFYFYDTGLLHKTLFAIKEAADLFNYRIHYAVKANANKNILQLISSYGMGADCVSGNEINRSIENGFHPNNIVFAGVGKTDTEISLAIEKDIFCINCESLEELQVIHTISRSFNKKTRIALRINPNIDAKTHQYITTGLSSNKFGISFEDLNFIIQNIQLYPYLLIDGLHFHIGSQITDLNVFKQLCSITNDMITCIEKNNVTINHINLGEGLGINYDNPENQIPDFKAYLTTFKQNLNVKPYQTIHFEPGRSIVGQSGILISRVLYVKENNQRKTLILDSGFTELLRPALYQANHKITNLSSNESYETYDIAGPICETSDYFGKSLLLPKSKRGDLIAIMSTGAYGEVMSSNYNLRTKAETYYSDNLPQTSLECIRIA